MAKPILKKKWNNADAFGLINGISTWDANYHNLMYVRLPNESNIELRHKINRIRDNPIYGTSRQDLINGLSNELLLDSYNVNTKKTFHLTRQPVINEIPDVQDVFVEYKVPSGVWTPLTPQRWSKDIPTQGPFLSGFLVWEQNTNHENYNSKPNYSKILEVYSDLPNETELRIKYSVQILIENNIQLVDFTDTNNPNDPHDDRFTIHSEEPVNDLSNLVNNPLTQPIVYGLSNIPDGIYDHYYDYNGKAKAGLYRIRDIIDKNYRHRWRDVVDNDTIWDVHTNDSGTVIPSFYDTSIRRLGSGELSRNHLAGGIDNSTSTLQIMGMEINNDLDIERWFPQLKCGPLYQNGYRYQLMKNPKVEQLLSVDSGGVTLPSAFDGLERHHKVIMCDIPISHDKYFYRDYDYSIVNENDNGIIFKDLYDGFYRNIPFLNSSLGHGITTYLTAKSFTIDFDNRIIYSDSMYSDVYLIWDESDFADQVTVEYDMNPINDVVPFNEYFLVTSET